MKRDSTSAAKQNYQEEAGTQRIGPFPVGPCTAGGKTELLMHRLNYIF